ncbi:MAG: lipoyl(octanoyl) transferase LipB [Betaproteobacteria bacterium]|nr:lipoyl(octanoyl) transferase LipB [Betaproteobacteria bacterium]
MPVPVVRALGTVAYAPTWEAMKAFTDGRGPDTPDEFWTLEHPPVYTLGVAGREEHLRTTDGRIPVVRTDRGGQVTYHGPGQVVVYTLLDLRRLGLTVRTLVRRLEAGVVALLAAQGVEAHGDETRPGVYAGDAKIAALGLKIRRGCSYHGVSLNVDMDLSPFAAIDPCGHRGLVVTDARRLGIGAGTTALADTLVKHLMEQFYG